MFEFPNISSVEISKTCFVLFLVQIRGWYALYRTEETNLVCIISRNMFLVEKQMGGMRGSYNGPNMFLKWTQMIPNEGRWLLRRAAVMVIWYQRRESLLILAAGNITGICGGKYYWWSWAEILQRRVAFVGWGVLLRLGIRLFCVQGD